MDGFDVIYTEHFADVYRYTYSLCKNDTLAEEITQETFYRALENLHKFDGKCRLYVWLCQIAKNTYFSYLKNRGVECRNLRKTYSHIYYQISKRSFWTVIRRGRFINCFITFRNRIKRYFP